MPYNKSVSEKSKQTFLHVHDVVHLEQIIVLGIEHLQDATGIPALDPHTALRAALRQATAHGQRLQHRHVAFKTESARSLHFTINIEAGSTLNENHVIA